MKAPRARITQPQDQPATATTRPGAGVDLFHSVRGPARILGGIRAGIIIACLATGCAVGLTGCGTADSRTTIAMAAAASQNMESADKAQVLIAAMQDTVGPDGRMVRRWPTMMLGGRLELGMPVIDKKGNLAGVLNKDGTVTPVYGGLCWNFEKSFTDANRTLNSIVSIGAMSRAAEATAKAAETTAKEETKRLASDNATKLQLNQAKLDNAAKLKELAAEESAPTPTP